MPRALRNAEVTLHYHLSDLPTAQHKAGLAGLLLLIESMRQRGLGPLPDVYDLTATSARLTFSREAMQAVFDDLYDAKMVETSSKTKRQGKAPKREEVLEVADPETGKAKKNKRFIYDDVVPKASFLAHHYPGDEEGWLKLWQNMVWESLRTRFKNRQVYEERAAKKPSGEAESTWKALVKLSQDFKKGNLVVADISSSLCIGAQESNTERVPFVGRVEQNFLLHFWPLTVHVFRPQVIERDKNRNLKGYVLNPQGYVIAVPEVSDLEEFCDIFPRVLASLDVQRQGYLPRAALIDLPPEGRLRVSTLPDAHRPAKSGA